MKQSWKNQRKKPTKYSLGCKELGENIFSKQIGFPAFLNHQTPSFSSKVPNETTFFLKDLLKD